MTSFDSRSISTGRPTGMWISLAVVTCSDGIGVLVLDVPPPLVAGDLDAQRVGDAQRVERAAGERRSRTRMPISVDDA